MSPTSAILPAIITSFVLWGICESIGQAFAGKQEKNGLCVLGAVLMVIAGAIIAKNLFDVYDFVATYNESGFFGKLSMEIKGFHGNTFFLPLNGYELFVYILWSIGALLLGAGAKNNNEAGN